MSKYVANSNSALLSDLSHANSGDIIELAPGNYDSLLLRNLHFASNVTITSESATNPAVLLGLNVLNDSGLTFSNLDLSTAAATSPWAFRVTSSSGVNFENIHAYGPSSFATSKPAIGGLLISDSQNVSVTHSTFQYMENAVTQINNNELNISHNTFQQIWGDGVDGGGSSNVIVNANQFENFIPNGSEHPDAIQFWTTNTTSSAHNITVAGNDIERGTGSPIQGIFLTDQVGNLPFEHINISDNTISGEMYNGIMVQDGVGVTVSNNTVVSYSDQTSWIRMEDVHDLKMANNASFDYIMSGNTDVSTSGDVANAVVHVAANPNTTLDTAVSATLPYESLNLIGEGSANISLVGNPLNNTIAANSGADLLTGGAGHDTFVFAPGQTTETITDWYSGGEADRMDVTAYLKDGLAPTFHQSGANALVTFGDGDSITLLGVQASTLSLSGDYILGPAGF